MRRPEMNVAAALAAQAQALSSEAAGEDGALVRDGVVIARVWHWTGAGTLDDGVSFVAGCSLPVGAQVP